MKSFIDKKGREFKQGQNITIDICGGRFDVKIREFKTGQTIVCRGDKALSEIKIENADLSINQAGIQTCYNPCFAKNTCQWFANNTNDTELRL